MTVRGILAGILWLGVTATSALAAEHIVLRTERAAVVEMRVAALIMSGQQGGGLPVALAILPSASGLEHIIAMIEVDGAALLDSLVEDFRVGEDQAENSATSGGDSPASYIVAGPLIIELFAYVLGDQLDVLDQQSATVEIDTSDHGDVLAATGLKWFLPLALAPSTTESPRQLRVLVRVGNTFGLRGMTVTVSSAGMSSAEMPSAEMPPSEVQSTEMPAIWPPAFAELDEPWLVALPEGKDVSLPPPFSFDTDSALPTSRALMTAGEPIAGQAFVASSPGLQLIALIRSPGEAPVAWPLVANDSQPIPVAPSPEAFDRESSDRESFETKAFETVPFTVDGIDLDPGLYEMALAWGPDSGVLPKVTDARARSSYVPVFIASPLRTEAQVSDPADELAGRPVEPKRGRRPPSRKLGKLLGRVATDYVSALRQLVVGDRRAALATLNASEARVVEEFSVDAVPILAEGQAAALASLEDAEWRAVLPATLLHIDLSREYRRQRRFILNQHATRRVVELANAAAARLATPEASAETAGLLASLGSQYQLTGSLSQAKGLFEQALAQADDATALFGLATLLEKRGQFAQAVPVLERLAALRADFPEGRLRLALNRCRSGRSESAREDLRQLARQTTSDWVAVIAHQELARLEIERGDSRSAVKLLRRGLARWPSHPTLTIQLAYVLESQGQSRQSLALLTDTRFVASAGSNPEVEARQRSRYNNWSEELSIANRRQLDSLAQDRLADLDRWLAKQPGADSGDTKPSDAEPPENPKAAVDGEP